MISLRGKPIFKEHDSAKSIIQKGFGLMFRYKVTKPLVFYFAKDSIIPLHMFFVFTSIDVLYLDKKFKIIEMIKDFKPFTVYTPKNKARYILELPKNSIKQKKIVLGQRINIKSN